MIENDWKARSIKRNAENKQLKKKIKELTISRDLWKEKHMSLKKENEEIVKKLKGVKKKLKTIMEL